MSKTDETASDHVTVMDFPNGKVYIGSHCGSFGEPLGKLEIWTNSLGKKPLKDILMMMEPGDALRLAQVIVARAKQARARRKRWDRQQVPGYLPLESSQLDIEDRGALP